MGLRPTPPEVGGLAASSSRGALVEGQGLRARGRGDGRPAQTPLLPFYGLTVSEAALTRTSAIRLPRCLGPETRGGGEGEGRGWGAVGEESPLGRGWPGSRKMPPLQGRP